MNPNYVWSAKSSSIVFLHEESNSIKEALIFNTQRHINDTYTKAEAHFQEFEVLMS